MFLVVVVIFISCVLWAKVMLLLPNKILQGAASSPGGSYHQDILYCWPSFLFTKGLYEKSQNKTYCGQSLSSSGKWLSKANRSMKIQVMLLFWETLHLYLIVYKYTHPPPPVELRKDWCEASGSTSIFSSSALCPPCMQHFADLFAAHLEYLCLEYFCKDRFLLT